MKNILDSYPGDINEYYKTQFLIKDAIGPVHHTRKELRSEDFTRLINSVKGGAR